MSDDRQAEPQVVVGPTDSIPEVLERIRDLPGQSVALVVPSSSGLFLTASEFRALKAAADQAGVDLRFASDDRLRRQMASMFAVPVVDLLPLPAAETARQRGVATLTERPATTGPARLTPSRPLPGSMPAGDDGKPTVGDDEPLSPDDLPAEVPLQPLRARRRGARASSFTRRRLAIVGALTAAALLFGLILAFLFQSATVTLTMARAPVTTDLVFGVAGPGATAPAGVAFTLPATQASFDVTYQAEIPVTGEKREPLTTASGRVQLRNPTNAPITIAQGSTLTTFDGVTYAFQAPVTVPAASKKGVAGQAEGAISAATGGEAGNREPGMLSGKLDNGVYYMNRQSAIAGGTDKVTKVVDQHDIDTLVGQATAQLPVLATQPQPDGRVAIPGSVQAGEMSYTATQQVGAVADTVGITATMRATGLVFSAADASAQASDSLSSALAAAVPAGSRLVEGATTIGDPAAVDGDATSARFRLTATGSTRIDLDDATRDEIARAVAGRDIARATRELRQRPNVTDVTIDSSPGFLPARIPGNAGRITVKTR